MQLDVHVTGARCRDHDGVHARAEATREVGPRQKETRGRVPGDVDTIGSGAVRPCEVVRRAWADALSSSVSSEDSSDPGNTLP